MSRRKIYTTTKAVPLACLLTAPLAQDWKALITVTVYRDTEWDEYQCFYRINGKAIPSTASGILRSLFLGAHHTDSKADAISTADSMIAVLARNPFRKPTYLAGYRECDSPQARTIKVAVSVQCRADWQDYCHDLPAQAIDAPSWLPACAG